MSSAECFPKLPIAPAPSCASAESGANFCSPIAVPLSPKLDGTAPESGIDDIDPEEAAAALSIAAFTTLQTRFFSAIAFSSKAGNDRSCNKDDYLLILPKNKRRRMLTNPARSFSHSNLSSSHEYSIELRPVSLNSSGSVRNWPMAFNADEEIESPRLMLTQQEILTIEENGHMIAL